MILLAMMLSLGVNAQRRGGGQGPGTQGEACYCGKRMAQGPDRARPFAGLDLNEEQQEALKALQLKHHKSMKPMRNQMAELRLKQRNLMSEDEVNLNAVNKLIDQQSELSAKMQKMRAAHQVESRAILSEEQQMRLEQRKMHARKQRQGWHGRGRQACFNSLP